MERARRAFHPWGNALTPALEIAGTLRKHHGSRLSDSEEGAAARRHGAVRHFGAGKTQVDLVLRLLRRHLARRAPTLVLRRRVRPLRLRRAGFYANAPERR